MNKKMDSKKIMIIGIALLGIVAIASFTYAFFTVNKEGDTGKGIFGGASSKEPKIDLKESTSGIDLSGTYPMPDDLGLASDNAYEFEITNNEDETIRVDVILEVTKDSNLSDSLINIALDDTVVTLGSLEHVSTSSSDYKDAYKIISYDLAQGNTRKHTLKAWLNENGTIGNAQNKVWISNVLIKPSFIEKEN